MAEVVCPSDLFLLAAVLDVTTPEPYSVFFASRTCPAFRLLLWFVLFRHAEGQTRLCLFFRLPLVY